MKSIRITIQIIFLLYIKKAMGVNDKYHLVNVTEK